MLKPVETAPKGRKAKQNPEPEEAAAESVPHGVRRDHVVTDTGLAAKFNGPKRWARIKFVWGLSWVISCSVVFGDRTT